MPSRSMLLIVSSLMPLLVSADSLLARAKCNADNCARAATGSVGVAQSTRLAACSAYQTTTATYIVASEIIVSTTMTVPTFAASKCSKPGSYASACSCAGITASTTTTLLYPSGVPCPGGASPDSLYTVLCGYNANPETNKGVPVDVLPSGAAYSGCQQACSSDVGCDSFYYNSVSGACTLYEYDGADVETRSNVLRGAPGDVYAYLTSVNSG